MEHIEIDIIHTQFLKRLLEHAYTTLASPNVVALVGELGADEIVLAFVAREGYAQGIF